MPLPVASLVHQIVVQLIGAGHGGVDFAALLALEADLAGMDLVAEDVDISDALTSTDGTDGQHSA